MKNNHNNIEINDATLVQNSAMGLFLYGIFVSSTKDINKNHRP
ncbi:Uncharacterised protein [Proteus vulgaris]|nr:Uncharacterised protein [Proteus vulgaris]